MHKIISLSLLLAILFFAGAVSSAKGSENNKDKTVVLEILTWKAKSTGVSDRDMIAAVEGMVKDLRSIKGFQSQTLYKDSEGTWVDIYYWDTEHDAHASNDAMADKASLSRLIKLIEPGSIAIKVMQSVQSSTSGHE